MEKNGRAISLCSGCVETLKSVNHELKKNPRKMEEINGYLASIHRKYSGNAIIDHAVRILYENIDKIKKKIVNPLDGLKVACHYGCHYLRPSEIMNWDDPFDPSSIDEIIEVLGAESIDYSAKLDCCGNPLVKSDETLAYKVANRKLKSISNSRAEVIVVVCPACYTQFDINQHTVNKIYNENYNFPVFYLTELIALAFGFSPKEIGLKYHRTKIKGYFED